MGAVFLLLISFAVILAGALVFTNAVEWLGHRLDIGEGATGSILAAVGTAMPETLIPVVAIISGGEFQSNDHIIDASRPRQGQSAHAHRRRTGHGS